jgi:sortase A
MRAPGLKRCLSFALLGAGGLLLGLGAREFIGARAGQSEAAREFEVPARISTHTPIHYPKTGDTVARLSIPRLDASLYVVEGDGDRELRRGPGHVPGTALPGAGGNTVIAGHRDTHFRVLKNIRKGDDIVLDTDRGRYVYRVLGTSVVRPSNTSALKPAGSAVLHLITCYPFYWVGSAPERFIVEARLQTQTARLE